ncbi:hypothetical protein P7C70_g8251, partial [Phenoliferia sp. Uapishka_3]
RWALFQALHGVPSTSSAAHSPRTSPTSLTATVTPSSSRYSVPTPAPAPPSPRPRSSRASPAPASISLPSAPFSSLPSPAVSLSAPPPAPLAAELSTHDFAEAILAAVAAFDQSSSLPNATEEFGRQIAHDIANSWLGADEELQKEFATILLDPAFTSTASTKYADAPTSAILAQENSPDIPTGAFPLAMDHKRRLSYAFAKSVSRATRLSFLTPVPPATPSASSAHHFSSSVVLKHQQLLYRSIIKTGVEAHAGCVLRYIGFCEENGVPATQIFPADTENVFMFLSSLGGTMRTATIGAYANAIRFWHTVHGLDFSLPDERFRVLKQGFTQVEPGPLQPRPPVSTLDLLALREGLLRDVADPEHPMQKPEADCIWAAATGAFHGMARSCDVTVATQPTFDPAFDLAATSVKFYKASPDFAEHVTLALPFDKVKRRVGAVLYLVRQASDPRLDPVQAMASHFESNDLQGKEVFAFSYIATRDSRTCKKGELLRLTNSYFIKTVNGYLLAANRSRVWGHSFRIGGATMYLLAGKHIDSIRVLGRWSSNAFDRYWRDIKLIAANHIRNTTFSLVRWPSAGPSILADPAAPA